MSILTAIGLGQLQIIQHILQEMEGEGVTSLAEARHRIFNEFSQQRGRRLSPLKPLAPPQSLLCPECGLNMTVINNADPESDKPVAIIQCRKCRYSRIVEGTA